MATELSKAEYMSLIRWLADNKRGLILLAFYGRHMHKTLNSHISYVDFCVRKAPVNYQALCCCLIQHLVSKNGALCMEKIGSKLWFGIRKIG